MKVVNGRYGEQDGFLRGERLRGTWEFTRAFSCLWFLGPGTGVSELEC